MNDELEYLWTLRGYAADPGHWDRHYLVLPDGEKVRGWCLVFDADAPLRLRETLIGAVVALKYSPDFDWPRWQGTGPTQTFYTLTDHPEPQANQLRLLDAIIKHIEEQR